MYRFLIIVIHTNNNSIFPYLQHQNYYFSNFRDGETQHFMSFQIIAAIISEPFCQHLPPALIPHSRNETAR